MTPPSKRLPLLVALTLLGLGSPVSGWTPKSQVSIARQAGRLAPPDLSRQIWRHRIAFQEGVMAPFRNPEVNHHQENPDGQGRLDEVIWSEVERAVDAIEHHRGFENVVYRLGVVSHYVADANNPLNTSAADPQEPQYFADYLQYMESVEPRVKVIFYGLDAGLDEGELFPFLHRTFRRSRSLYPFIGREYRRIGRLPGQLHFDDRSTAFGVASIAYSRAVSDVAQMLRYVWITAGGADWRTPPTVEEDRLLVVSRPTDRR